MTTARIDWSTLPATVVPVILVAGVPVVLTPAGVHPTAVAVTSGSVDPLFWPGTGTLTETLPDASTLDPVAPLLDPTETFEVYEKASPLKGITTVEPLVFSLVDPGDAATAMLSVREARVTQFLAGDITDADASIPLSSLVGFPASGIACIGRETVTYDSAALNTLLTCVRGKYGSVARCHTAPGESPPIVAAGGPRHWQGRLCTLWLCTLSDDGTTLGDPSLAFAGTVGAGIQILRGMARWSISVDHVAASLSKIDAPPIDLYGYAHFTPDPDWHPLLISHTAPGDWSLNATATAYHNSGWHPDALSFFRDANIVADTLSTHRATAALRADGHVEVTAYGWTDVTNVVSVSAAWDGGGAYGAQYTLVSTGSARYVSTATAPEAFFHLAGPLRIPSALDFARIPTTFSWSVTTAAGMVGTAELAITADTAEHPGWYASITDRDAATQTVTLTPLATESIRIDVGGLDLTSAALAQASRCEARTAAKLGITASGDGPVAALRAASLGIAAVFGQDALSVCIDWDDLERAFNNASNGGLPQAREYSFGAGDDTFLSVLVDELRLRGMCVTIRKGRITGRRLQSFADSEGVVASILETDLLAEGSAEMAVEIIDNREPLATSFEFTVPDVNHKGRTVTVTDTSYLAEFGGGESIKCKALMNLPLYSSAVTALTPLINVAQQVLAPLAEPNRLARLPLTMPQMDLQPGDLVAFTNSRVPNWNGTRGFAAAVCQVQEMRRLLFGGKLQALATLRLQSGEQYGYAPEALIAAAGLSHVSTVVTLDIGSGFGETCFAPDLAPDGTEASNATYGFRVGDKVRLSQIGARTPIADESFTITAINTLGTITLNTVPSVAMTAAAAAQYGVLLRFDTYATAIARQRAVFAWVADATTEVLGSGDDAKRWAA